MASHWGSPIFTLLVQYNNGSTDAKNNPNKTHKF